MKADLYFTEELGYIPVKTGHPRVDGLGSGHGQNGIDGLYQKPDGDGEYVVIEVKSNNNGTSTTNDGNQLSTDWLLKHLNKNIVDNQDLIDDVIDDASRVLVNYESVRAGDISMQLVDDFGNSTNIRFNP